MGIFVDLSGKVFGRLTVLHRVPSKDKNIAYLCECECGRVKVIRGCDMKQGKSTSCGCFAKELTSWRMTGSNHHSWAGGTSREADVFRNSSEYKEWRLDVYHRDNFTCSKCGYSKGGTLQAHHILSFSRFPEARLLVDNGDTLCKKCHNEFHDLYGRLKFTDKDYWGWLRGDA